MTDNAEIVARLKQTGHLLLTGKNATRGRVLEIRRLAKAEGLDVRFRSTARCIYLHTV